MAGSGVFGADEVARKEFATSFRGFDQHEVRAFLGRLAAELAALQTRERSLEERLAAAEARAVPTEIGETELENALGHETAKVLHAAREAAAEIRGRAEEQVARLLRDAGDEAGRMREEAGMVLADRTAEAEQAATAIREAAAKERSAQLAEADAAAAATIEAAKEHGRRMVGEAQAVRERILKDLARRRRIGQQQLEQLRAGRDRLLEACRGVQAALDTAMAELVVSEPEARAAAETAGLRVSGEPELTLEELEAEVVVAVDAGLVVTADVEAPARDERAVVGGHGCADSQAAGVAAGGSALVAGDEAPAAQARQERARGMVASGSRADEAPDAHAPHERAGGMEPPRERTFAEIVAAGDAASRPVAASAETKLSGLRRKRRRGAAATVGVIDVGGEEDGVRLIPNEPDGAPAVPTEEPASAPGGGDVNGTRGAHGDRPTTPGRGPIVEPGRGEPTAGQQPQEIEPTALAGVGPPQPVIERDAPESEPPESHAPESGPPEPEDVRPERADGAGTGVGADGAARAEVDDVFARIRANRAATVARAAEVLAEDAHEPADVDAPNPTHAHHGVPDAAHDGVTELRGGPETGDATDAETAPDVAAASALVTVFEQRDAAVEPHERALTKALKRALADEQNEMLDALRRARGVPALDALLPPVEEHEERYRSAGRDHLAAVAAAAAGVEDAVDIGDVLASLGREVVVGLRPRLERALIEGAGDEMTTNEALSAAYREWKTSRAEPLARHHVLAAHAEGAFAAADAGALRWFVDPEAGCSPDCADNALAGRTDKGKPFPTGQAHPPAHAGCRCLVLPAAH